MYEFTVVVMPKEDIGKDFCEQNRPMVQLMVKEPNHSAIFHRAAKLAFPDRNYNDLEFFISMITCK